MAMEQQTEDWVTYAYVDTSGQPRSGEGRITGQSTDDDGVVWLKVSTTYGFAVDVAVDHPEYDVQFVPRA